MGGETSVLVLPASHMVSKAPRVEALKRNTRKLAAGEEYDREELVSFLADAGYVRVPSVFEAGTFAIRGSLLDLFSPGQPAPVRIDFFGEEIDSMALFNPDTQMSDRKVKEAHIYPATEVLDRGRLAARARKRLLALADELDYPSARLSRLMDGLREGELPAGTQALLPILADVGASVFDYLDPSGWMIVYDDQAAILASLETMKQSEANRYRAYLDLGRLALPPARLYLSQGKVNKALRNYLRVNVAPLDTAANYRFSMEMSKPVGRFVTAGSRLSEFEQKAREYLQMGFRVAVSTSDERESAKLAHLLAGKGLSVRVETAPLTLSALSTEQRFPGIVFYTSALEFGVESHDLGLYVVTSFELFDKKGGRTRAVRTSAVQREKLLELQEGDYVVHREYGIGRFGRVVRKVMGAGEYTCLQIAYARNDTLYVPIHNADIVQKYVGSGKAAPKLDRLGSASWQARVRKARAATRKLAFSLLELYASRQAARGHAFSPSDDYFEEFEASFPYDETPDQAAAVEDVLLDMERAQPMDRLVCGDVGFGKTEVAIRAAFKAILDGRQVAILVPTTILAEQHRITFQSRLALYPVMVDSLSRFKSKRQQADLLRRLEQGRVDVVIGTHRLLGGDVKFKDLGLLVIDEEHRFGVGHKEKLKALRAAVDVLSMTATPIPRTLHMAMTGIRDLSVIKTPPPGRLDIQTSLVNFDTQTIADAIRFELQRSGQVFFLHNRVEDILTVREQLAALVPEAKIAVAHGQMRERVLERTMVSFMSGEENVLLCTTIIESGLDIPTVNTLIVNNAHEFGLAQLYQIRGRIGRSSRQAFAIFVVPPVQAMSSDARARLATLAKFSQVGSGFQVASVDMELRGAGDLLGAEQSGHVAAVGFDMYVHLLQDAVEQTKEKGEAAAGIECQVEIATTAFVPEAYIPDRHQRLVFYRMIASTESLEHLEGLRLEMRDRFGPHPVPAKELLAVAELKLRGQALGMTRVEAAGSTVRADLSSCPDRVLDAVLALVKEQPVPVKVTPGHMLVGDFSDAEPSTPVSAARRFLGMLEERCG